MREILGFLELHGLLVVFVAVLAEQVGVPVPAGPVLLAAGALAGADKFPVATVVALATVASLLGDAAWYVLGRRKGQSILNLLCRISLEPESCVGTTKSWFERLGASSLFVAKFVPGLSTAAPPMAGATRMPLWRFLVFDAVGSGLWAAAFVMLGFFFSRELERVLETAGRFGAGAAAILFGLLALYLGSKFWQRERFLRSLRSARIEPDEVLERIRNGEELTIVDLRHALELGDEPMRLPGAIRFEDRDLAKRHEEIPRDRDIILYCS